MGRADGEGDPLAIQPMPGRVDVHVWEIPLDPPAAAVRRLEALLAPGEVARADRFRRDVDRRRFVVGRGMLRTLLGRYRGEDPATLAITYGPNGKPELRDAATPIRFNLAHSHERGVLAIVWGRRVGVDVEHVRPMERADRLVERFFTEAERRAFAVMPEAGRLDAFFRGWTCKEAYLKAIGTGLAGPLESVGVNLDPEGSPGLLCAGDDPDEPGRWELHTWSPDADYRAALAVERVAGEPPVAIWFETADPLIIA